MSIWTAVAIAVIFVAIGAFILWRRGKLSPKAAAFVDTAVKNAESFEDRVHNWAPAKPAPPVAPTAVAPQAISPSVVAVVAAPIAASDPSGTVIAPAPIIQGALPVRDPFVIGPQVVAWALRQSDNFDVQTSAGAHPEIGIDGCDAITNYLCANPSFTIDAVGFEAAYQKTKAAPQATHPNPPIALTPEVSAKLVIYTTKCLTDWDKIAYLKLGGNSDLFNYLATNNLITSQWFMAADYATNSGQNFPAAQGGALVPSPRVWE